jgi:hypothetical protein
LQRTDGSIRQAPSSSPLTSGRRRWLTWLAGAIGSIARAGVAPWWRAIEARIISRSSCSFIDGDRIDDGDDGGVDRRAFPAERLAGGPALEDHKHLLRDAGADAVDREQRMAARRVVDVQRLHQQQLRALEFAVLLRRHDGANYTTDLHLVIG